MFEICPKQRLAKLHQYSVCTMNKLPSLKARKPNVSDPIRSQTSYPPQFEVYVGLPCYAEGKNDTNIIRADYLKMSFIAIFMSKN